MSILPLLRNAWKAYRAPATQRAFWDALQDRPQQFSDAIVVMALQHGANGNLQMPESYSKELGGQRPLSWALGVQRWSLVKAFLKHGVDPKTAEGSAERWRMFTPEHQQNDPGTGWHTGVVSTLDRVVLQASRNENDLIPKMEVIHILLDQGHVLDTVAGSNSFLQVVQSSGSFWERWPDDVLVRLPLNRPDEQGQTPLHWAVIRETGNGVKHSRLDASSRLIRLGANPHALNNDGDSALHLAVRAVLDGKLKGKRLTRLCREHPNLRWNTPNGDGHTPLSMLYDVRHTGKPGWGEALHYREPLNIHERECERTALFDTLDEVIASQDQAAPTVVKHRRRL